MIVMKFGGTSVGSAERIQQVAKIIQSKLDEKPVVVLSAVGGVTDMLLEAATGKIDLAGIRKKHTQIVSSLGISEEVLSELDELETFVKKVGTPDATQMDTIVSFGERLSTKILAAYLVKEGIAATAHNAYDIGMQTDSTPTEAELLPESYIELEKNLSSVTDVPIVTGFIGKSEEGVITTFGRGGSDYTAAIIGAALAVSEIQIWTDVTGVMSADPRIVKDAHTISEISYDEAAELSYFGAKVLHPKTILPAVDHSIPVVVLNTLEPTSAGTRVVSMVKQSKGIVKAISSKKGITVVNVSTSRMMAAPGFLADLFTIFAKHKISVDMLATSEVSVSLTVDNGDLLGPAITELEALGDVTVKPNNAIIIVVGEGLKQKIGKAAPIFDILSDNKIHVEMISQGASEINIGFVIEEKDVEKAVKVLHKHYFGG